MSKDITIKQDGVAQDIDEATEIHTSAVPSGTNEWIPEDEAEPYVRGMIDGVEYIVTTDSEGNLVYTPVES